MKTVSILTMVMFLFSFMTKETKKHFYPNGKLKDRIEIENGMFNGKFSSWYDNGQKKAEGTFKNNQRFGKWTVYDSLGKLRMTREYENPFTFKTLTSKNGKGENVTIPVKLNYDLKRGKEGYYTYPEIDEKYIADSKRFIRTIASNSSNSFIFDKNKVFDIIQKSMIENKSPKAYMTYDFKKYYNQDSIASILKKEKFEVVAYKISEIWFYDTSWQLSETRIIGLCPVIKDKTSGAEMELFWLYYPELRSILVQDKLIIKDEALISNMEDVFQFKYFNSQISQEFVYEEKEKANSITNEKSELIQMDLLDKEHDLWIALTEKK
jgi:hypothetical protein